jgi:hypothetical protein
MTPADRVELVSLIQLDFCHPELSRWQCMINGWMQRLSDSD